MSSDLSEAWVEEVPEPVAQEVESDPDRIRGIMQDYANPWYPVRAPYRVYTSPPSSINSKLPPVLLGELIERRKTHSLRQLAREYGVSHETIRKAVLR